MGRRASGCAGRRSCTASGGKRREASARLGISGWLFAPLNHSSGCDLRLHRADRGTSAVSRTRDTPSTTVGVGGLAHPSCVQ